MELVELRNASRTLPGGARILSNLAFTANAGESASIIGTSGSGKSTLLAGLGLIAPFDAGTHFRFAGVDIAGLSGRQIDRLRGRSIGFVLQNSGLVEHLTALENTMAPFLHRNDVSMREGKRRALEMLARVGLSGLEKRRPSALSGGEKQRVAIARAVVTQPDLILADEPTGALDTRTGQVVIDQLIDLVKNDRSCLVIVTHDTAIASRTDRQYRIESGVIEEIKR